MKFQLSAILIIILFFLKSGSLLSQQIYLSPEGNDSNPGTMYQPLATMPAARDRARILRSENSQQPVEIIALEGEYLMLKPLELDHSDAGTAVSPTIFRAADGAKVIFRGGVEINGFEKVNDNLWKAFVPQVAY